MIDQIKCPECQEWYHKYDGESDSHSCIETLAERIEELRKEMYRLVHELEYGPEY